MPDFTQGDTVAKDGPHDWTLGATGVRGWIFTSNGHSALARQILVTAVAKDSPAAAVLSPGDVILGVDGAIFSSDARIQFASAIGAAETEGDGGKLRLLRWRAGKSEAVIVALPVLGSYSATAPYDCPKSKRIFELGCQSLARRMSGPDYTRSLNPIPRSLNALALLASGNKEYLPLLQKEARWAADFSAESFATWYYGSVLTFLAEHVMSTGDQAVMPGLKRLAREAARGQSAVGTWGHKFAQPNGNPNGYGCMNQPGLSLCSGMVLAREAGVEDPALDRAIAKAAGFVRWFTGRKPFSVPAFSAAQVEAVIAAGRDYPYKNAENPYDRRTTEQVLAGLSSWSPSVRLRSAAALGRRPGNFLPEVLPLLASTNRDARYGACEALGALGARADAAAPQLRARLKGPDPWRQSLAAEALPNLGAEARKASVSDLLGMTLGANVFGRPLDETIIFTHHRMFLPTGAPVVPPDTASRLFEVRRLIDRGPYKQATRLAFDLSGQEGFMYPDPFVPAFDLRITMPARGEVRDYVRSVDFQTGQATVRWADDRGAFERRLFVSRADGVAVLLITGPGQGAVDCTMELPPRNPSPKLGAKTLEQSAEVFKRHVSNSVVTAAAKHLTFASTFTRAYPGSIHRLEGVGRVVAPGGAVSTQGSAMVIKGADQVLAFVGIEPIYDPDRPQIEPMKKALGDLPSDYARLLERHAVIHGGLFNRMRLDLGGGADHRLTTEELLARSSNENLSRALTEKVFDAGRHNIISCTGELLPTLQGVWAGTYVPSWASDFTHNGNVPSAIAAMLPGNTPELMLAYTSYIESIVPYLRVNAKTIANALKNGISEHYDSLSGKALGVPDYCMSSTLVTMMLDGLTKKHILKLRDKSSAR